MQLASKTYDVADIHAVQELYHSNGWTDGLPIVPPTAETVHACLEWAMTPPDQLIGIEPVRGVAITAEKLAINAVMAGCLPMHFPAVLTAFSAMLRAGVPAARRHRLHRRLRGVHRAERSDPPRTRRRGRVQRARQQRSRHRGDRPRDPPRADQHPGGAARRHRSFHSRPPRQVQLLRRRGRGGQRLAAAARGAWTAARGVRRHRHGGRRAAADHERVDHRSRRRSWRPSRPRCAPTCGTIRSGAATMR